MSHLEMRIDPQAAQSPDKKRTDLLEEVCPILLIQFVIPKGRLEGLREHHAAVQVAAILRLVFTSHQDD